MRAKLRQLSTERDDYWRARERSSRAIKQINDQIAEISAQLQALSITIAKAEVAQACGKLQEARFPVRGNVISSLMEQNGLTCEELAERSCVDADQIRRTISEDEPLTTAEALSLASALGVSVQVIGGWA